jgi:2-polyprenyl-6-methoxyphenol hydroxylase-like FAD-dependent oxidoreductase
MLDIPQHDTEKLLRRHVAELGGVVEGSTELIALTQETDRVVATVKNCMGEIDEISAEYVVGCDGAHSRVRHELGLSFDGLAYEQDWLLADVLMDWNRPQDEVHAFFRPDGLPMICFPLRNHVWRLVFPYTGDRGRQAPTLQEIQQLVDQRAPEPVRVSNPSWLANFGCSLRSAPEYRRGRVMLAGDAVHVHSPAGGQGMNTGMQDAHNLAWKLALVISGRSPESLLDTYAEERGPVAAQVLSLTHALVQLGTVRNPFKRTLRDIVVPFASRIPPIERRAVRRVSQVHITYRSGSLTRRGPGSRYLQPGDRAPDVQVVEPGGTSRRLYEAMRSGRHILVASSGAVSHLREWSSTFDAVTGDLASGRRSARGSVWLVRPDGYIAASGIDGIVDYLRHVFSQREDSMPWVVRSVQASLVASTG